MDTKWDWASVGPILVHRYSHSRRWDSVRPGHTPPALVWFCVQAEAIKAAVHSAQASTITVRRVPALGAAPSVDRPARPGYPARTMGNATSSENQWWLAPGQPVAARIAAPCAERSSCRGDFGRLAPLREDR